MITTTMRIWLHEFARGCVALLILGLGMLFLIAVGGPKSDTQEAAISAETERKRQAGLLPAEPIRFVEREDQPPTAIAQNFGAIDVDVARGEEAGR